MEEIRINNFSLKKNERWSKENFLNYQKIFLLSYQFLNISSRTGN